MRVASRTGILRSCLTAASSNSILQAKFATYLLERIGPAFAAGAALQRPLCKIDILQILEMLFERFSICISGVRPVRAAKASRRSKT